MDAIFGSPDRMKFDEELLYIVGVDVFVGTIGNSDVVKTREETGFHNDTPLISCVV